MATSDAQASLGAARAIAAALIGGVTTFAVVAWVESGGEGVRPGDAAAARTMLWAWAAAASAAIVVASVIWRRKVAPLIESPRGARGQGPRGVAALQTSLVAVWAVLEGAALFGVVVYYVFGPPLAVAGGLLLVWMGIGLTFPRSDWFPRPAGGA